MFMRHFSGVGPRKHIMPKFIEVCVCVVHESNSLAPRGITTNSCKISKRMSKCWAFAVMCRTLGL